MTALNPFTLLANLDRVPPGNGYKDDIIISPNDFRANDGTSLPTGSGNEQIVISSSQLSVFLAASALSTAYLGIAIPGRYDASPKRASTVDRFADGDYCKLRLLCKNSTSGSRSLAVHLGCARDAALTAFTAPADITKSITGTSLAWYEFDFGGSLVLPRDILTFRVRGANAAGDISIYGGVLAFRNNLVNFRTTDR